MNKELRDLVRSCVQCALCLPHCATWVATGNEVNSPRGRLLLLEAVFEDKYDIVPEDYLDAFDQCIGCRACEAMCPSGVPFSLLEYGQQMALGKKKNRPPRASLVPGPLLRKLDSPTVLSGLHFAADIGRTSMQLLGGKNWRQKLDGKPMALGALARLLGSLPHSPDTDRHLVVMLNELTASNKRILPAKMMPAESLKDSAVLQGPAVAFFHGCASANLLPGTSGRMRDILKWSGCEIIEPENQGCCGALADHTGRPGTAAAQLRAFQALFATPGKKKIPIIVEAAGCAHHLQNNLGSWTGQVTDALVFMAGLNMPFLGEVPLKVVYHDPCHALHGQGIKKEPRYLLGKIPGLELVEPVEAEVCCGSGGAWALRYPELSMDLAKRKASNLAASGAQLVVTSNPGCLGQISDGLDLVAPQLPILPLSDLLWFSLWLGRKIDEV